MRASWRANSEARYIWVTERISGLPTARRLSLVAADMYRAINPGAMVRTSAMLSKPKPELSTGSSLGPSTSSANRS
jgi:hypothetical protein